MLIEISEIIETSPKTIVEFSTEVGKARGFWVGEIPIIGSDYFVEIDIDSTLSAGRHITQSSSKIFSINMLNNKVCFVGRLESLDADGFATVRCGDSIFSFLSEGLEDSEFIDIRVDYITLFQYAL